MNNKLLFSLLFLLSTSMIHAMQDSDSESEEAVSSPIENTPIYNNHTNESAQNDYYQQQAISLAIESKKARHIQMLDVKKSRIDSLSRIEELARNCRKQYESGYRETEEAKERVTVVLSSVNLLLTRLNGDIKAKQQKKGPL